MTIAAPRVTVLLTGRERFTFTERAIDLVLAHADVPMRFVVALAQPPAPLRQRLAARAAAGEFEFACHDEALWPTQVRRRFAPSVTTDYLVMLDNDVLVHPGWLGHLVRCADESGAGMVGPLYLEGHDEHADRIHMAGGELREVRDARGRALHESHRLPHLRVADVEAQLQRDRCDFVEFHCMLVRAELARDGAMFDEDIVCMHEHIHACLTAHERGAAIWFEPAARVVYLDDAPYQLGDLPLFRQRWTPADCEASIASFRARWDLIDDVGAFEGARDYITLHLGMVDPLRPVADTRDAVMTPADVPQDRAALLALATRRGYAPDDLGRIERTCRSAEAFACGITGRSGRPLIRHLVGTAGVLAFYNFRALNVAVALLHGTPAPPVRDAGPGHDPLIPRLRAYADRAARWPALAGHPAQALLIGDAELVVLAAASRLDRHWAGIAEDPRNPVLPDALRALAVESSALLGAPGLARTLQVL